MDKLARIFVAGHAGLVGSALVRRLQDANYQHILSCPRSSLDLTDPVAVRKFFFKERPEILILAEAQVGLIRAKNEFPLEFLSENL